MAEPPRAPEQRVCTDLEYEMDDKGQRVLVKSMESTVRAYLRFTNRTSRPVDVWWRDYRGRRIFYVRLLPNTYHNLNSFVSHPWVFSDAATDERYVIRNNRIFRPPANVNDPTLRTNWNITIQVRSLRRNAMLALAGQLRDPATAYQLGLPQILANELYAMVCRLQTPLPVADT